MHVVAATNSAGAQVFASPPRQLRSLSPHNTLRICHLDTLHLITACTANMAMLLAAPLIRRLATAFPDAAIISANAAQRRLIDYTSSLVAQQCSHHKPEQQRPGHKGVRPGSFTDVLVILIASELLLHSAPPC